MNDLHSTAIIDKVGSVCSAQTEGMTKRERITRDYLYGGLTVPQLAKKYNRTPGGITTSLWQWGVRLPPEERARRQAMGFRKGLAKKTPSVWPDCPEHLKEDYQTLRRYYGAHRARAMLEGRADD